MKNYQEDKRSMYIAVKEVVNKFKSIWVGFVAFVEAFTEFEVVISDIDVQRIIQEGKIKGISTDKQKEAEEMIQITVEVASAVYAYAAKTGNNELMIRVNYSDTKLNHSRDTELIDICQLIHDEANKIIAQLADYGKTPSDLAQLQKEINDYVAIIAKPGLARDAKAIATAKLKELFKKGDAILKTRLDKLMEKYKKTEPKFYSEYKKARIIITTATQTIALKVLVNDKDGNPIPCVSATIINVPANKSKDIINEISKKTTTKGAFQIINLVEGNYKIIIKKIGYNESTQNFIVVNGETTKLNLQLETI